MSKAEIIKYWCDICRKETLRENIENMSIPIYRTFDSNDGHTKYNRKEFHIKNMDICYSCLDRIVKVQDIGVQCENFIIRD